MAAWAQPLVAPKGTAFTPQDQVPDLPRTVISLRAWHRDDRRPAGLPFCVPPSLCPGGAGILTGCPSATPFGLALGPPNPTRINLPSETLGLRRTRFSRVLTLLMPAFSLLPAPPVLTVWLRRGQNAPLPMPSVGSARRLASTLVRAPRGVADGLHA